jgi:hypothetical protein
MIRKSLPRGGSRFSEKVMLEQNVRLDPLQSDRIKSLERVERISPALFDPASAC